MHVLKQDRKNMKKILALFMLITLLCSSLLLLGHVESVVTWKSVYLVCMIAYLVIQGYVLFGYTKNKNSAIFVRSFPYYKGELFFRKWLHGLWMLLLLTIVYAFMWIFLSVGTIEGVMHCFLLGAVYHSLICTCAIVTGRNDSYFITCMMLILIPYITIMRTMPITGIGGNDYWFETLGINMFSPLTRLVIPFYQCNVENIIAQDIFVCLFYIFLSLMISYYVCNYDDASLEGEAFSSNRIKDVFVTGSVICFVVLLLGIVFIDGAEMILIYLTIFVVTPLFVFMIQLFLDKTIVWKKYWKISLFSLVACIAFVYLAKDYGENYTPEQIETAYLCLEKMYIYEIVNEEYLEPDVLIDNVTFEYDSEVLERFRNGYEYENEVGLVQAKVSYLYGQAYYSTNSCAISNDYLEQTFGQVFDFSFLYDGVQAEVDFLLNTDYDSVTIDGITYDSSQEIQIWKEAIHTICEKYNNDPSQANVYYSDSAYTRVSIDNMDFDLSAHNTITEITDLFMKNVAFELNIS